MYNFQYRGDQYEYTIYLNTLQYKNGEILKYYWEVLPGNSGGTQLTGAVFNTSITISNDIYIDSVIRLSEIE